MKRKKVLTSTQYEAIKSNNHNTTAISAIPDHHKPNPSYRLILGAL